MKRQLIMLYLAGCFCLCMVSTGESKADVFDLYTQKMHEYLFPLRLPVYEYEELKQAMSELAVIKIEIVKRQNPDESLIHYTYKLKRTENGKVKELVVGQDYNADWNRQKIEKTVNTIDFGTFANSGDTDRDLNVLAAFLANISQETRGGQPGFENRDGLCHVRELGAKPGYDVYDKNTSGDPKFDSIGNANYYGRGAKQLSYPVSYALFSFIRYGDHEILLRNPEKVEGLNYSVDPSGSKMIKEYKSLAFASAVSFWMLPEGTKPSCDSVLFSYRGFAKTINVINGGVETRKFNTFHCSSKSRARYYRNYRELLEIPITGQVENSDMYLVPWNIRPNNFDDIAHDSENGAGPVQPCPCPVHKSVANH